MKKFVRITLLLLACVMIMSLCSCTAFERIFLGGDPFSFSDIVMTQTGVNEYNIKFTVDSGNKDVDIYFTEGSRLSDSVRPIEVEKTVDGKKAHFSFTKELILGENYYLWVIRGDQKAKISIPAPSMFPSLTVNDDGTAVFNFNYTYDTAWDAFCDPTGKAVYKSQKDVFDDSAVMLCSGIDITDEFGELTAEQFDPDCYYYSVTTGKDGILKVISNPVMIYDEIIAQVDSLSAKITSDLQFQVEVGIPSSSEFAGQVADKLQLLIKTGAADEIYVVDCEYKGGVATMSFDCTNLIFDGLWYDVVLVWDGAVVMDIPKNFDGKAVDTNSNVKKDGIVYSIVSWKPDNAPAGSEMIKICFEEDSTRYADEILKSYIVTFDAETASLMVTAKIKGDVAPVLAITSGDKTILASADGVKNADGSYSYTLAVEDAFTRADNWYDLRFFVNNTAYEMLKDSCITYSNFANKYEHNARVYEFREWNGMLKLMYTDK